MKNETSNKEWELAESVANNIQKNIHTYYMESVIPSNSKYIKADILVPMTENINMTFSIDIPYDMMDCGNSELLEYFKQKIYPYDKYLTENAYDYDDDDYDEFLKVDPAVLEANVMKGLMEMGFIQSDTEEYLTETVKQDDILNTPINYMDESVKNNLPAWREELLPKSSMDHIIQRHTLKGRVETILNSYEYIQKIRAKFHLNKDEFIDIRDSILDKLDTGYTLNKSQKEIVEFILTLNDIDIYPQQMSDTDIKKTIRIAYHNAKKIGKRQISERDEINANGKTGGAILYQGEANNIIIHFWFNFNDNEISTAYPIFFNPKSIRQDKLPENK